MLDDKDEKKKRVRLGVVDSGSLIEQAIEETRMAIKLLHRQEQALLSAKAKLELTADELDERRPRARRRSKA